MNLVRLAIVGLALTALLFGAYFVTDSSANPDDNRRNPDIEKQLPSAR